MGIWQPLSLERAQWALAPRPHALELGNESLLQEVRVLYKGLLLCWALGRVSLLRRTL